MNFLKRAMYSITRKKGKSIILLIIIFILGNMMAGSIAIKQAAENVEKNMKAELGGQASVKLDNDKLSTSDESEDIPELSKELVEKIGNLPEVKYYDYTQYGSFRSSTLKSYVPKGGEDMFGTGDATENMYFTTKGVQYPNVKTVEENGWKVNGRTFTQDEIDKGAPVAVIPKGFAEANNLSVGDKVTFKNVALDYSKMTGFSSQEPPSLGERDVELEVIGVFEPDEIPEKKGNNAMGFDDSVWQNYDRQNTIYVPNALIELENKFGADLMAEANKNDPDFDISKYTSSFIEPTYVLNSPDDAEKFKETVSAMLPNYYKVSLSSDSFDKVAGALQATNNLANIVLYVSIIATVLILTLLIVLFLRDRKHELGIYLSLGEKRSKVIAQVVVEIMVVAIIGISASLFTGNLLAGALSESMLLSQMESAQNIQSDGSGNQMIVIGNEDTTGPTSEDILENYKISLSFSYVLLIYGIGLGTVLVAVVGPMIYILRLNPKKIML